MMPTPILNEGRGEVGHKEDPHGFVYTFPLIAEKLRKPTYDTQVAMMGF